MSQSPGKPPSDPPDDPVSDEDGHGIALPAPLAGSGALDRLVETARDYARAALADATLRA